MMTSRTLLLRWLLLAVLVLAVLASLFLLRRAPSTSSLGKPDFVGYWSATYLIRHGQNPYDLQSMNALQHVQMQTGIAPTIMAWNPPSLFVFLLPLSWLPFDAARFALLALNVVIVLVAGLMLARLYAPNGSGKFVLACMILAISFPQTLSGIYMGQVSLLVLLGLVSCMVLITKGQWFWAGAVLILTTIKPQLVVLSVIYLLGYMGRQRRYQGWLGLCMAGVVATAVLFGLRPAWISDVIGEMSIAPVHWATPTIGGFLSYIQVTEATRSLIILLLPLPFILLKYVPGLKMETAVALLTLITVPTTFFGWSYDEVMLLIPIVQVLAWMSLSKQKIISTWLIVGMGAALIGNYYQRVLQTNEVYYVWVPLAWWVIYGLAWYLLRPAVSADG